MGVEQWSSGDDSPSRSGFNITLANIEARTAIDQRTPAAALPSTGLVPAEYFQRTLDLGGGSTAYSLYRTDPGSSWHAQAWVPERLLVRPPDTAPAVTAEAFRVEHTSVANGPGLSTSWDGGMALRKQLILGGSADGTIGRLSVGGLDAVPASVRARITPLGAERGLEIRAGDSNVTELFRGVDSSGNAVLTISGSGQLTSTQAAAFGGISPGLAPITVAPNATGSLATGLLAYGQSTAPTRPIIQANRYQPGGPDTNPIFTVLPSLVTVGRTGTAWTSGEVDIGAPVIKLAAPAVGWFPDPTSIGGVASGGFDTTNGLTSILSALLSNSGNTAKHGAQITSYPGAGRTWSGDILQGLQTELISGNPDSALVAKITPFGQIQANALWRGTGTKPVQLRDVRQGIVHQCKKKWVNPGDYPNGLYIPVNGSYTYTWPQMTVRSSTLTQLDVQMRMELLFFKNNSGASPDRQVAQVRWYYKIGGGSYTLADSDFQEGAAMVADSAWPQAPGVQCMWTTAIPVTAPAGSTFQIQMIVSTYPYASDTRLRRADLAVYERIIEVYNSIM